MQILLGVHAFLRWLILVAGLALLVKYAVGTARQSPFTGLDRGLAAIYTGLLDLQLLVGIILLLLPLNGGLTPPLVLHVTVALVGVAVAHLNTRWRSRPDVVKFRNGLLALGGSYALILVGVFIITSFA